MKEKLIIDKNEIKNISTLIMQSELKNNIWYNNNNYDYETVGIPGKHEYNLYSYLSNKFNDTIILDIGTGGGGSAVAFSQNKKNKVITYDLIDRASQYVSKENVEFRFGNFMEDKEIDYNNVSIIMIDVDPHDGLQEPPMFKFLEEKGWSGLLLLDDIGIDWLDMWKMWNSLPYEKFDVTDVGHYSGTGLINFGKKYEIEIVN